MPKVTCYWCFLLITLLQACYVFGASSTSCDQVHASARIVRASSPAAVAAEERNAPAGYIVEVAAAFRRFELQPRSQAQAVGLLQKIPSDQNQHELILALAAATCEDESDLELEALARIQNEFPRMLAKAVRLAPDYLEAYVRYALIALNPHSDYAIQMQSVCRNIHRRFTMAVATLSETDRKWFKTEVIDPKSCRAIAIPEAE